MKGKLIAMTLLTVPLVGFVVTTRIPLEPTSTVWVEGGSTVRGWKCTAKTIDAQLTGDPAASVAQLVTGATVVIPVEQLDCGNGKMNEHMRKALQADKNPNLAFSLDSYEVSGTTATLKGSLEIAGTTRAIEIPATISEQGKEVRVKASKQINMKEWGVKPPSLMLGTMKVKEVVTLGIDVGVKR
ncbi:MAG TPA: YceI family protein [Longimicrobiales bacterium]